MPIEGPTGVSELKYEKVHVASARAQSGASVSLGGHLLAGRVSSGFCQVVFKSVALSFIEFMRRDK